MEEDGFISNVTRIEGDTFGELHETVNVSSNLTSNNHLSYWAYFHIITAFTNFLICLSSLAASIFLIVIIRKFKYLQTRPNYYIFNYAILNLIYFGVAPICLFISHWIFQQRFLFCIFRQTEHTVHVVCLLMILGLALDWFLKSFKPSVLKTCHWIYEHIFLIFYIIGGVKLLIFGATCFAQLDVLEEVFDSWILWILYIIVSITVLIIFLVKRKSVTIDNGSKKEEYSITIAGLILLLFLPEFIFELLSDILYSSMGFENYVEVEKILMILHFIPISIGLASPIIVLYKLGRLNKNFQMAYDTCFKRSVRKYENENIDDEPENDINRVSYVSNVETATVFPI